MRKAGFFGFVLLISLSLFQFSVTALAQQTEPFTMIIASDPQLPWACEDKDCGGGSEEEQGKRTNSWQVTAMNSIQKASSNGGSGIWPKVSQLTRGAGTAISKPLGVIINGDLTAYFHPWQFNLYDEYYRKAIDYNVFPGLGNHDYKNNVRDCYAGGTDYNGCAKNAVNFIRNMITYQNVPNYNPFVMQSFDEGSLAYSFDIGTYHFVQLHFHPLYSEKELPISPSMDWLDRDMATASILGKKIVINLHSCEDDFVLGNPTFQGIIKNKNLVAVFSGHLHEKFGYIDNVPQTKISHFKSGSSSYRKFLLVEFGSDYINVATIDSRDGKPSFLNETASKFLSTYSVAPYTPPIGSGSYWSIPGFLPGFGTRMPSALAEFKGKLYAAWNGYHNDGVYYASFDGTNWGPQSQIPFSATEGTTNPPALAVLNGKLYCAWVQPGGVQQIHLAHIDEHGKEWTRDGTLKNIGTQQGPALAAHNNKLYCAWNGYHNDGIYYASFDGTNWSGQSKISQSDTMRSDNPPALVAFKDKLYCAWMQPGADQHVQLVSKSDGDNWDTQESLSVGTQKGPALAVYKDRLYCAWNGYHNDGIFFATFDGTHWTRQTKAEIRYLQNGNRCSLATYNGRLFLSWEQGGIKIVNYTAW